MPVFLTKITIHAKRHKSSLKHQIHENQTQTWEKFANYQTAKFKITVINMLRNLMEKEENVNEQVSNVGREMETPTVVRRYKKPNHADRMKTVFGGFISRLNLD